MNLVKEQEIFAAALEIADEREREAMIERACAGDAELRKQVAELLAVNDRAEEFFSGCVNAIAASGEELVPAAGAEDAGMDAPADELEDVIGSRIGPYKLLQKIGEGGCGAVYMAEQERPVRRRVALKIIKLGMDTKNVIARFEAERQALAMMDHPNIARVLDAGATDTGRPFFVMELVHGIRITRFCDENSLSTRERLGLFIQVCQAIQHAHQKGIIHRDIKPSNILVTLLDGMPVPKVIDFGIAKAIEEKLTDRTLFTLYGHFIGTPAYMSPEQAQMSAVDVDTRSDIYSLGVLLYELLTGKPPFDQEELLAAGIDGMRRTLSDREPHRPSTKLDTLRDTELTMTARRRHVEPLRLRSELRGDLDWIVMRALEKDRSRRYQTANGMALDVQRFLDNEPIQARPPSRLYRLQKLFRRNKVVFVASAVAVFALTVGFGTSTWMFFRERKAHQEQVRLREITDNALANEALLRSEAEAQVRITQAAILLSRNKFAEADRLVEEIDLPVMRPSLEAAGVFRRLAEWNVTQGRWHTAADRLLKLTEANQIDKTDMTDAATRDLLKVGPALVLVGDTNRYRQFLQGIIARFRDTENPVAAEQLIKASTLLPLDAETIRSLEPLVRIVEDSLSNASVDSDEEIYMCAWRAVALARFECRRGNYTAAIKWGKRTLSYSEIRPTCIAMAHSIVAIAHHGLDERGQAAAELAIARELTESACSLNLDEGISAGAEQSGYWNDWVEARLLVNEASARIEGREPPPLLSEGLAQAPRQ